MLIMFIIGFIIFCFYIGGLLYAIYWGHSTQRKEMENDPELRDYYNRHHNDDPSDFEFTYISFSKWLIKKIFMRNNNLISSIMDRDKIYNKDI